jgi:SAM-dependent methyltransferase
VTETAPLSLTGERTLPGIPEENYWFQRHVVAYRFAAERVAGLRALDAGCGEGYGAAILAGRARSVVGVDLDRAVVAHAAVRYPAVRFEVADLLALPFPDGAFEAVVCLQVVEHVARPADLVAELARVLGPGGLLVLSTPNRLTFSPDGIRNPFHTAELTAAELRALLAPAFRVEELLGTFHGPRIALGELVMRRAFPERLLERPASDWPLRLRRAVARVRPGDFRLRARRIDRSLDLVAVARRR